MNEMFSRINLCRNCGQPIFVTGPNRTWYHAGSNFLRCRDHNPERRKSQQAEPVVVVIPCEHCK